MADEELLIERRNAVAWMTLNRPRSLNALNPELIGQLEAALTDIRDDRTIKAVVIGGSGRAFSAGIDIKASAEMGPPTAEEWRKRLLEEVNLIYQIWDLPQPVVAAVHGYCLGFACDLVMACDMVVAADDATFGEPEIRYASASTFLLMPFVLGLRKTKDLLLTGESVDAQTAERIGLVSQVVPADELQEAAGAVATKLAVIPEAAMHLSKVAINKAFEFMGLREAVSYNLETFVQIRLSESAQEWDRLVAEKGFKAALAEREQALS